MKKAILALSLVVMVSGLYAQGTVKFANISSILISWDDGVGYPPIPGNAGTLDTTFYFGVLSAPLGIFDPTAFVFAGVYATNRTTPGRLQGGNLLYGETMNSTWRPLETRNFEVVGWSAYSGPEFNPEWLTDPETRPLCWGISTISSGMSGGYDPVTDWTIPPLTAFSGSTVSRGFIMARIPEPNFSALAGLGAAAVLLRGRKLKSVL